MSKKKEETLVPNREDSYFKEGSHVMLLQEACQPAVCVCGRAALRPHERQRLRLRNLKKAPLKALPGPPLLIPLQPSRQVGEAGSAAPGHTPSSVRLHVLLFVFLFSSSSSPATSTWSRSISCSVFTVQHHALGNKQVDRTPSLQEPPFCPMRQEDGRRRLQSSTGQRQHPTPAAI